MFLVSPELIWEKLNQDKIFAEELEPIREVTLRYIETLPTSLAKIPSTPATLITLTEAKIEYLRYCADNCLITIADKKLEDSPDSASGILTVALLKSLFKLENDSLLNLVDQLKNHVAYNPLADEKIMLGPIIGLNQEAKALYITGRLTIQNLWLIQPSVFIRNS